MDFHNSECEAHAEFKDGLRPLLEGILVVVGFGRGSGVQLVVGRGRGLEAMKGKGH
jgi:hypothetical protein